MRKLLKEENYLRKKTCIGENTIIKDKQNWIIIWYVYKCACKCILANGWKLFTLSLIIRFTDKEVHVYWFYSWEYFFLGWKEG